MPPEVDVVILSLDRQDSTIETIESVLSQLEVSPRVWIIDQASKPPTLEALRDIADHSPQVVLQELKSNVGVAAGRNIGMDKGSAKYIVSIDNDAVFGSQYELAHVVDRFKCDPKLGALGFRIRNFFTGDDDRTSWVYPRSLLKKRDQEFYATRYCGAGHALLRNAVKHTSGYDGALFFYWEELDLSYQLIQAGFRVIYLPSITVLHKIDPEARTNWSEKRFYYYVRNAIYIDWKYFQSLSRIGQVSIGYLLKGIYNRIPIQAVRGIRDSFAMIKSIDPNQIIPLSKDAREYIYEFDLKHRGSVFQRFKDEVLEFMQH